MNYYNWRSKLDTIQRIQPQLRRILLIYQHCIMSLKKHCFTVLYYEPRHRNCNILTVTGIMMVMVAITFEL